MLKQIKRMSKHGLRSLGYDISRIERAEKAYPYIRSMCVGERVFDFWIADARSACWYDTPMIEQGAEGPAMCDLVRPGDRILDVGCHHGFFTVQLAQATGPDGIVVALDVDPFNCMTTQAQVCLNGLSNCRVLHRAAADKRGICAFSMTAGGNTHVVRKTEKALQELEAVRLDDLDREYGPFDLLKIDVEGFEGAVLQGAAEILRRRPKLALELHVKLMRHYGWQIEEIVAMLPLDEYEGSYLTTSDAFHCNPLSKERLPEADILNVFLRPAEMTTPQSVKLAGAETTARGVNAGLVHVSRPEVEKLRAL